MASPCRRSAGRMRSSTTSGSARPSAATASTGRRSSRSRSRARPRRGSGSSRPGRWTASTSPPLCPYDPARARALLAEAGYGPQKPLVFELMTNTEKSVFSVIATVIKEQVARIGVTANIRLVDKVSWMNTATQDGPFDMYVEDLASLMVLDQNTFLSASTASWNSARHTDPKVDEYYARYAREMDPAKRKPIAKGLQA